MPFFVPMIPVKLIREQLEILHAEEDKKLERLLSDAIDMVEHDINRVIKRRQIRHRQHNFHRGIGPLRTPLASIDSIEYLSLDSTKKTVSSSSYVISGQMFDKYSDEESSNYYLYPEIDLEGGFSWPQDVSDKKNSVVVTYTAGFKDEELPDGLRRAILIAIATLYENRELLSPVQLYSVPAYEFAVAPYRKTVMSSD